MLLLIVLVLPLLLPHPTLAARGSAGCGGSAPAATTGSTFGGTFEFGDVERTYSAFVPSTYDPASPLPLVMSFHGWGGTSLEDACDSGLTAVAANTGAFMVVHPQGLSDYESDNPSEWGSWHFNGTCQNGGASCNTNKSPNRYCYESNADCQGCDWTTCADDTAFLSALYDHFEATLCVDLDMMYATGMSNGGMMAYQMGASLAHRLAGIAPTAGSLHWNALVEPEAPIPVFAVTGRRDATVPGNASGSNAYSSDGTWRYYTMDGLAEAWGDAQECDGVEAPYPTSFDGVADLWCKTKCSNIDHVLCSWNGGHNYYTGPGMNYEYSCTPENADETYYSHGELVWEFFSRQSLGRSSKGSEAPVAVAGATAAGAAVWASLLALMLE